MQTIEKFDRSLGTSKREQGIVTPRERNRQAAREGRKHAFFRQLEMSGLRKAPEPNAEEAEKPVKKTKKAKPVKVEKIPYVKPLKPSREARIKAKRDAAQRRHLGVSEEMIAVYLPSVKTSRAGVKYPCTQQVSMPKRQYEAMLRASKEAPKKGKRRVKAKAVEPDLAPQT